MRAGRENGPSELLRESDTPSERLESGVGSQSLEAGVGKFGESRSSLFVGFLKPFEGLVIVANSRVDDGEVVRADILLTRQFHQVTKSRSEEHTSELQSQSNLVCRLLL